jgi:hypothetical protein
VFVADVFLLLLLGMLVASRLRTRPLEQIKGSELVEP